MVIFGGRRRFVRAPVMSNPPAAGIDAIALPLVGVGRENGRTSALVGRGLRTHPGRAWQLGAAQFCRFDVHLSCYPSPARVVRSAVEPVESGSWVTRCLVKGADGMHRVFFICASEDMP